MKCPNNVYHIQPVTMIRLLIFTISFVGYFGTCPIFAQIVDWSAKIECTLPDGEILQLFPSTSAPTGYYCLPSHLRLSVNEDKQPEFLLMLWANEGEAAVSHGIMHWLITWGLDKDQENFVRNYITTTVDSTANLLGTLSVNAPEKYVIKGKNTELTTLLNKAIQTGGSIPTTPGGKSATSFKIEGENAVLLQKIYKNKDKWKDVWIEMPFFDLNGTPLCTLQLGADRLIQEANKCTDCFIVPD
jgi:hypothetical protein